MSLEKLARIAIEAWEANPKRQALAKILNLEPGQISDEMLERVLRPTLCLRNPPIQQIPRKK